MYFRKEEKEAESDKLSWLDPPQQDYELYAPGAHAESWGGGLWAPPTCRPPSVSHCLLPPPLQQRSL